MLTPFLAICSLAICLFAMPIGRRLEVIDMPQGLGGRKRHAHPTPLVGGIAIMTTTTLALAVTPAGLQGQNGAMIFVGSFMLLLGFLDDRSHISPSWRLMLSIVAMWVALAWHRDFSLEFMRLSFVEQPLFLGAWALPFTILCLVGLQNAVNMADGKNGLVIGMSMIWVGLLILYDDGSLQPILVTLGLALLITLVFNLRGKLFLGDAGCYSISVLIGLLAISTHLKYFDRLPADAVVIWFLVPVLDCIRLMTTRLLAGRAPFEPDRNHLHHFLWDTMPWRYGLVLYWALVALPSLGAYFFPALTVAFVVLALVLYGTVFLVCQRRRSA